MTTESFFALAVGGMIALFFGSLLLFGGYRFFIFLLPVFGFFFGFGLGAQAVQALFGDAFLSTVTSWVVGFAVAVIFALLAYLFYIVAVALIGGALGYALATGVLQALGLDFGVFVWTIGILAAVVVGAAVVMLNIQKYVVIVATAFLGAGVIIGTFLFLFGGLPAPELTENAVRVALQNSPWWAITFIVLAGLGIGAQYESTRNFEVESYNHFADVYGGEPLHV